MLADAILRGCPGRRRHIVLLGWTSQKYQLTDGHRNSGTSFHSYWKVRGRIFDSLLVLKGLGIICDRYIWYCRSHSRLSWTHWMHKYLHHMLQYYATFDIWGDICWILIFLYYRAHTGMEIWESSCSLASHSNLSGWTNPSRFWAGFYPSSCQGGGDCDESVAGWEQT